MVGVVDGEEVELGIVDLVLADARLKLGTVASDEARGLVDNVPHFRRWVDDADRRLGRRCRRRILRTDGV